MNSTEYLIKCHEGKSNKVYIDSLGNLTCGIGHALHVGSHVPDDVVNSFFKQDMNDAYLIYKSLDLYLDDVRQAALVNMCFNLGNKIKAFVLFLDACRNEDWQKAGSELKNSLWWSQVGDRRTKDIFHMITTGQWPEIKTRRN